MYGYKRLFLLIFIMACICSMVGAIAIYVLYLAALDEERARLTDTVRSQARLIESVARFDRDQAADYPGGAEAATLLQIEDAHRQYQGFGDTGGFAFGRREGADIVFLHSHRQGLEKPPPLPATHRGIRPGTLRFQTRSVGHSARSPTAERRPGGTTTPREASLRRP